MPILKHADAGPFQCRGIIHAITCHCDHMVLAAEGFDNTNLMVRRNPRQRQGLSAYNIFPKTGFYRYFFTVIYLLTPDIDRGDFSINAHPFKW
jgi:hypothetical protein